MIFSGKKVGVNMFPGGKIEWFSDPKEAARVEKLEVIKFTIADREREAKRLAALGIMQPPPLSFRVSLADQQPGHTNKRHLH